MPALAISRYDHPGSTVLIVVGEIDICTAPQLQASLHQVPRTDLVLDLSAVGFLGMAGLHLITEIHDRLRAADHRLVVVESPWMRQLTRLTGLCAQGPPLHTIRARAEPRAFYPVPDPTADLSSAG